MQGIRRQLREPSPSDSHRPPPAVRCYSTWSRAVSKSSLEAPHPGCSLGAGPAELHSADQHPRLTEGKEDIYLCGQKTCEKMLYHVISCSINHMLMQSKHSEASYPGLGIVGTSPSAPPQNQVPRRQPKAGLVNRPFIQEVSGLHSCLFCTDGLFIRQGWCNW